MKLSFKFAALLPLLVLAGCQTLPYEPYARQVTKKPGVGGVIALRTEHRDEDKAKANSMMTANCGSAPVKVLEEGEVVVGSTTASNANKTNDQGASGKQVGSLFGLPVTSGGREASENTATNSTTMAVKEWNISYECEKAVATEQTVPAKNKKR